MLLETLKTGFVFKVPLW